MANPMPGVQSDTCQLDPDEVDPQCIDNEQYFDHDLGMYVLCDIIVCDDELVGEGGDGGSPNAPDDECTIACDPGWGEPGGGGSGGINLPANPANEDIFVVIDPVTGETFDLTFLQNYLSWLSPELYAALHSTLMYLNIASPQALPNFSGDSRVLTTMTAVAIVEPSAVGEVVVAATFSVIAIIYIVRAADFFMNLTPRVIARRNMCAEGYAICVDVYSHIPFGPFNEYSCQNCLERCNTNGFWDFGRCNITFDDSY